MSIFLDRPREEGRPYNAAWIVDAPWAHPLWQQYNLMLFDLTTPMKGHEDATLLRPDMTHQLMVWAVNPEDGLVTELAEGKPVAILIPQNFAYQFHADDDEQAKDIIQNVVNLIEAKTLNPDTDFRYQWDILFQTIGVSMRGRTQ